MPRPSRAARTPSAEIGVPLSRFTGWDPLLDAPIGYSVIRRPHRHSAPRTGGGSLRSPQQDVANSGRVPLSPSLCGRYLVLVQVIGDLPQRVAPSSLALYSPDDRLRHRRADVPSRTPLARFTASASFVRCEISRRSNSENVASMLAIASPLGVDVSTATSSATSAQSSSNAVHEMCTFVRRSRLSPPTRRSFRRCRLTLNLKVSRVDLLCVSFAVGYLVDRLGRGTPSSQVLVRPNVVAARD